MNLSALKQQLEREIDGYVYRVPEGAIGNPWPAEKVERHLLAFRAALVEPYWADVTDDDGQLKRCVIVADEGKGCPLVYEPEAQKFMLTMQKGSGLTSFGVDGDAVGCFFAR